MWNEYEDRVIWDDLAPSLQAMIRSVQTSITTLNRLIPIVDNLIKLGDGEITNNLLNFSNNSTQLNNLINKSGDLINIANVLGGNNVNEVINKLTNVIVNEINNPSSSIHNSLSNTVIQNITNATSDSNSNIYKSLQDFIAKTITESLDGTDSSSKLFETIRTLTFNNLPPKIGFLDDTTVKLQGTYNMSYMSGKNGPFFITDAEGRECLFAVASGTSFGELDINAVYRATRMTTTEDFIWENNAVRPKFVQTMSGYVKNNKGPLFDNIRVSGIWGLTSDWIGLTVVNKVNNTTKDYLVFTNGSGSPQNWGIANSQGYIDVSNVSNRSNMARIETSSGIYYVIPSTESQQYSFTDPYIRDSWDENFDKVFISVYKATEDRFSNHSVTLNLIRKDEITHGGWDFVNNSRSCKVSLYTPYLIYIKHMNCLLYIGRANTQGYSYTSSSRYYSYGGGYVRFQHGLISISNISTALTSSSSNYFGNQNNWIAYNIGIQINQFRYGQSEWSIPITSITYDELKRTISYVAHEHRDWGGLPSRSRLTIFGLNNKNTQDQFKLYLKNTAVNTKFPYSFSIDKSTYPDLKKEVECMDKTILSDDTAPWSKTIQYLFILHDTFTMYCSSKKWGSKWTHINPSFLKDPTTNTPYTLQETVNGSTVQHTIFTSAVGEWAISNGGCDVSKMSMVYTGGDYAELYYYNNSTREVFKTNNTNITLENGTTTTTYPAGSNWTLVTTFPDHNPRQILETYFASQINNHGVQINRYQELQHVYGNCSILGGEFIAHVGTLVCNIINGKVSQVAGKDDYDLTLFYPSVLLYFKNGTYKVYTNYQMAINSNDTNYANNVIRYRILDRPKTVGLDTTGYSETGRYLTFIDTEGSFVRQELNHDGTTGGYNGPICGLYDLRGNGKLYYTDGKFNTWNYHIIGYSKSLGYYFTACSEQYTYMGILCQKDYLNSSASYTCSSIIDMIMNKKHYKKYMFTSASVGKVAYLSKTALYLGGYFSYIDPQEVYLNEGHNYIYITRNTVDYELSVNVYDHLIGIPGESQFNRILISYIYVSNGLIVSQTDYDTAYYSLTSLV